MEPTNCPMLAAPDAHTLHTYTAISCLWEWIGTNSPTINIIILFVGLVFAIVQIRHMHKSRIQSAIAEIFARISTHNANVASDSYQRRAVEIFLRIPSDRRHSGQDYDENVYLLYWGTRILHLSHINLLVQMWLVCGGKRRIERHYAGWTEFARILAKDLTGETSRNKPYWYYNACFDIWYPCSSENKIGYPATFVRWMNDLSRDSS